MTRSWVAFLLLIGCAQPTPCVCTFTLPPQVATEVPKPAIVEPSTTPLVPPADTLLQTKSVNGVVSTPPRKMTKEECDARAIAAKQTDLVDPVSGGPHPSNIIIADCISVPKAPLKKKAPVRPAPKPS